jgi:hypothetical protein
MTINTVCKEEQYCTFFLELHRTSETLTTSAHSSLRRQILKIDEATTGVSLSTFPSPTTETTIAVKS